MAGLSDLYQEILLEHNSKPHNFKKVEEANQTADGYNPLCGDQITLYLKPRQSPKRTRHLRSMCVTPSARLTVR